MDLAGREYSPKVTAATYFTLKREHSLDLNDLGKPGVLESLAADVEKLIDLIWIVSQPVAWSKEEFIAALDGDTMEAGFNSALEAIIDFFPSAKRAPLRVLLEKWQKVAEIVTGRAMAKAEAKTVEGLLAEFDAKHPSPDKSGNSPESSASIPVH